MQPPATSGQHGWPPAPGAAVPAPPGDPAVPARRGVNWRRGLALGGLISFIALCGIGMLAFLGFSLGPVATLVGLGAAVLPVPVLVFCFLWLDRYEPEPLRFIVACFAWGACVATAFALLVNTVADKVITGAGMPDALVAVLVAPVIEESMKALGPFLICVVFWRQINGMIDAIVYCGLSAVGFAMVENILYIGGIGWLHGVEQSGVSGGAAGVLQVFIGRILFSGFAHPLFTSMTAIGIGIGVRSANRRVRWLAPLAGLLTAMMLHGSWNLMSTVAAQANQPYVMLYGYFGLMVPVFFGMVGFALWLRASEGRLVERVLPLYVRAGWFSPPEIASLTTLGRRHAARRWARRVAGDPGAKAMRGYQFDATRLALLRDGLDRGLHRKAEDLSRATAEELRLLTGIDQARRVFVGRDPATPRAVWDGARYRIAFPDGSVREFDPPEDAPVVPVPVWLPAVPFTPAPPPPPLYR